jgi:hypothetical protein
MIGPAYANLGEPLRSYAQHVDIVLHRLWTEAAAHSGYCKNDWDGLASAIVDLIGLAAECALHKQLGVHE